MKGEYHLHRKKEYSVSTVCVASIEEVEDSIKVIFNLHDYLYRNTSLLDCFCYWRCLFHGWKVILGQGLLTLEVPRSHSDAPCSVGLL